jgi:hypothetical protein
LPSGVKRKIEFHHGLLGGTYHREFNRRLKLVDGTERLVTFVSKAAADFELRSKDKVALVYRGDKLVRIDNHTINVSYSIF